MTRTFPALAAASLLALAGCGSDYEPGPLLRLATIAVPSVGRVIPGASDAPAAPSGFGAEDIAAAPGAYQLMEVTTLFPAGLARIDESGGDEVTWKSQYGYSAAFDDGILVATRGLGDDLMAANAGQVRQVIARGGGTTVRVHETLDSLDRIVSVRYDCTIVGGGTEQVDLGTRSAPGRKFTETCLGGGVQFENAYWLDASGSMIASRQFVSQTVAYLRSNRL